MGEFKAMILSEEATDASTVVESSQSNGMAATRGNGYPVKRFPLVTRSALIHNGDTNGFGLLTNGNRERAQFPLKGRSYSGKIGRGDKSEGGYGSKGRSFVCRILISVVIACFLVEAMLQGSIIAMLRGAEIYSLDDGATTEQPTDLPAFSTSDFGAAVKFVPHKLLQKFTKRNVGTSNLTDTHARRIPVRPPQLAIVCADLSRSPGLLLLLSIATGLKALGYHLELFSLEDGPVRDVWEKIGTHVNILQANSQEFTIDWLNFDGVVMNSLEVKMVLSSLMQEPFKVVPVIWIIHENTLGMRLRFYASQEHEKIINDWKCAFTRADVVVFSDYAMPMMYSALDSGNFFVIPGTPVETWEAEQFLATHKEDDLRTKLGYKSLDFVIVVVGSPFSHKEIWREHTLIMQAIMPLMVEFNMNDAMDTALKLVFMSNNATSTYGVALQAIALQLGFPSGVVQHTCADEDVNSILSIADLVLYGSLHEEQAFPAILIRAMSFEKPIIAPKLIIIQKYIEDRVQGFLFPVGNINMITKALFLATSSGKLSVLAHEIASAGRLHAKDLMVSDAIEGYSELLENVLQFPSEARIPQHVSEIPATIKRVWQWQLMDEASKSNIEYLEQGFKNSSVVSQIEEQWTRSRPMKHILFDSSKLEEETFSLLDWEEEKTIEMAEDIERREEEELEERRDQLKGTWEDVYRSVKRAERTRGELHERDDGELERSGQPLCIYEPYYGLGTWPFLHHSALYRGIGLTTKGRRPGADDVDAPSRLPLLNDAYYRDSLCEYGAFFAIANRVDRIHKNSWIGFQSWRAVGRKVSLSPAAEKLLIDAVRTGRHGDAFYFWARMDTDTSAGTRGPTFSQQEGFWSYCDAINAGNCRVVFSDTFKRMYGLPESWTTVPPMPFDGGSWSVLHSWAMPTTSFLELVMFARMFVDALDAQHYDEHHDNGKCCLSISKDHHCYCRVLELLVNVWAYHSARRMIYVNPETGLMQEQHKVKYRRGHMWVKWFNFDLLKSMDEDFAEEADTEHPVKRWLWPSTGEVFWQGIYERERHNRYRLKMEKKRRSRHKLVRMRSRYRQKSLGKYVKPPPEEFFNSTKM
eukprot:Gb_19079 [translate_table: standard]